MSADSKVVPIGSASSMRANDQSKAQAQVRAKLARLPAAVHLVQDKCKTSLAKALNQVFDNADDALFQLADKADNNHDQNLFFESMREVRLRRRVMESAFVDEIEKAFSQLSSTQVQDDLADANEPSLENLTLVQNDELEELVAIDSMINKAARNSGEILQHLSIRLDSLVPLKVYQKSNPVGPDVICNAFATTSKLLDVDIKAKLVLFKLFEKFVVTNLPSIYEALNNVLIEQGVLPSLAREKVKKQPSAPMPGQGAAVAPNGAGVPHSGVAQGMVSGGNGYAAGQPVQGGSAGYSAAAQTGGTYSASAGSAGGYAGGQPSNANASGSVGTNGSNGGAATGGNSGVSGGSQGGANFEVGVIMNALSQLQTQQVSSENLLQQTASLEAARIDLTQALSKLLLAQLPQGGKAAIGGTEKDVINLVKVLFEFILDDRNLAEPMKALISRLQIPMLKVALVDNTFFSKTGHPARRLLNEMATAALGWSEEGKSQQDLLHDSLYKKIASIVQTLLSDFDSNVEIFSDLLSEFVSFIEKERKRARIIEQRTIDAESGKAQAEAARRYVAEELESIGASATVPDAVRKILDVAWSNVLFLIYLKEGTGSEAWRNALETAKDLIWSATATVTSESRSKLMMLLPSLLKRLRVGLESISYNPYEMTQLLSALEKLHLSRLRTPLQSDATPSSFDSLAEKIAESQTDSRQNHQKDKQQDSAINENKKSESKVEAAKPATSTAAEHKVEVAHKVAAKPAMKAPPMVSVSALNPEPVKEMVTIRGKTKAGIQLQVISNPKVSEAAPTSKFDANSANKLREVKPQEKAAALEKGNSTEPKAPLATTPDQSFLDQVAKLTQGSWFEMNQGGDNKFRCRLAAIIKATGKYIFVNRSGQKVAEETAESLALSLQNGGIQLLDDGMLFDRALQSVIGELRKPRQA